MENALVSIFKACSDADKVTEMLKSKLGLSVRYRVARLAIGRSLGEPTFPTQNVDSQGRSIKGGLMFGIDEYPLWIGLLITSIKQHVPKPELSIATLQNAVRRHWHRGIYLLLDDWKESGEDPRKFWEIQVYRRAMLPDTVLKSGKFGDKHRDEDGTIEEDLSKRWSVKLDASGMYSLTIPTREKLAAVIDGQHRLFAFALVDKNIPRLDTQLICALFLDLPKPFQAQLFATINSTQKPVPKSLTYELFGYNISEEDADHWSPDKLAVFLSRKLNAEEDSPLKERIIIAPENDFLIEVSKDGEKDKKSKKWKLSNGNHC